MKLKDLRSVIEGHTTVWIQDNYSGDCLGVNEMRCLDNKYDECDVFLIYPERYPAISSSGITVILKDVM